MCVIVCVARDCVDNILSCTACCLKCLNYRAWHSYVFTHQALAITDQTVSGRTGVNFAVHSFDQIFRIHMLRKIWQPLSHKYGEEAQNYCCQTQKTLEIKTKLINATPKGSTWDQEVLKSTKKKRRGSPNPSLATPKRYQWIAYFKTNLLQFNGHLQNYQKTGVGSYGIGMVLAHFV